MREGLPASLLNPSLPLPGAGSLQARQRPGQAGRTTWGLCLRLLDGAGRGLGITAGDGRATGAKGPETVHSQRDCRWALGALGGERGAHSGRREEGSHWRLALVSWPSESLRSAASSVSAPTGDSDASPTVQRHRGCDACWEERGCAKTIRPGP